MTPRLLGLAIATALSGVVLSACGSRTGGLDGVSAAAIGVDGGLPPGCGDRQCGPGETCTNCSIDCGLCPGCGDKNCGDGETCSSCPQDCGVCETCGDGFCKGDETCLTCAPDCGKCPGCGDKTCDTKTEDCFTCPEDCGACKGCGDGRCNAPNETCASCVQDCGVCAVCGNKKCEAPYETCTNCHDDCGDCEVLGCMSMLRCAFGCIDSSSRPPIVRVSCVGNCVAKGCPQAQFLFDQAFNCFIQHLNDCGPGGPSIECLTKACDNEVAACVGATCPQGN
jgi:hypothetical protein